MKLQFKRTERAIYEAGNYQSNLVVEDHGRFVLIKTNDPMTDRDREIQIGARGDVQLLRDILDDILSPRAEEDMVIDTSLGRG